MRVVLPLSAEASFLPPSSPILLTAARGAHGPWARRVRALRAQTVRARWCHGGWGSISARTAEVQRREGRVGLERGGQLLGPPSADLIDCGTRGTRVVGEASACGVVMLWGGRVLLHALLRSSMVRVVLVLSMAASCVAPLLPIIVSAARGHMRRWRGECVRCVLKRCARGGATEEGEGAAARTAEVHRGDGLVGLERGGQLLGSLVAGFCVCGTRGMRASIVHLQPICNDYDVRLRRLSLLAGCRCI